MEQKTSTNIQVAIRIRPFVLNEKKVAVHWGTHNSTIYQVDDHGNKFGEAYSFDHIFGTDKTNTDIYAEIVKEFVDSSLDGLNSTIFAYGQTSSGKTYTMLGDKKDTGIMSLAIKHLFQKIENNKFRKFLVRISYMEIYNEKINDLLDPHNKGKQVKIRENLLQNMTEELVFTKEQMYDCLRRGNMQRRIASTAANVRSSRSHTIFKIMIESTPVTDIENKGSVHVSILNLVDLAGSERVAQTQATGVRLKEGTLINKSLSALSLVIKQLSEGKEYVNFRDSKLTRLLQDSIGGNSKTLIIATITLGSIEDTSSTLAFAQRAKAVKNKPHLNEIITNEDVNKRYATLNTQLRKKLDEQTKMTQELQVTLDEKKNKVTRLQQQLEMLHDFQSGNKMPESTTLERRRHTIGSSTQTPLKRNFTVSDFEKNDQDIQSLVGGSMLKRSAKAVSFLEPIVEDELLSSSLAPLEESLVISDELEATPPCQLRNRLSLLQQDYRELLTFTRDEDYIFSETSQELDNVRKQLSESQVQVDDLSRKLDSSEKELMQLRGKQQSKEFWKKKYKNREQELCSRIAELEGAERPEAIYLAVDPSECSSIMEQLISLQNFLQTPGVFKDVDSAEDESVLKLIDKFKSKVKTSRNIVESAILRLINNLDNPTDELVSFNNLLNELSVIESDIPVDSVDNFRKQSIEDFKILIKIYEFLIRRNQYVQECSEELKRLRSTFDERDQENKLLLKEITDLKATVKLQSDDLYSVTSDLMDSGELLTQLKKEKMHLQQEYEKVVSEKQRSDETIDNLRSDYKKLRDECSKFESLEQQHYAEIHSLKEKVNDLKQQHYTEIHALKERINVLNSENIQLNGSRNQIESLKQQYNTEMQSLKEKINDVNSENRSLKEKVNGVNSENRSLKEKVNDVNSENRSLKERINVLNSENMQLNGFRNQIESLKKQYNTEMQSLKEKINDINSENRSLKEGVNHVNSENSKLKGILNETECNYSSLKQKHSICCKFEDMLCSVMEQCLKEQKLLLLMRRSQDERDCLKNILKDLKSCHAELKAQLHLLKNQEKYDLNEVEDLLIKSRNICSEYFNMEKSLFQQKIEQLEDSNKEYLQEMMVLKDATELRTNGICQQCSSLENEVVSLKQAITSHEEALQTLKDQNAVLYNEKTERIKENYRLRNTLYEEQDRKAEVAYTDYLKFYQDSYKTAKQQVETLKTHVESLEAELRVSRKNSVLKSTKTAEVQCDLVMEKYNLLKRACHLRNDKIKELTAELEKFNAI